MDVSADKTEGERPHGVGKNIPAYCLDDVLNDLRSVTFNSAPFLLSIHAHISDGFAAELVLTDPGVSVSEYSARRQGYEHEAGLISESDPKSFCWDSLFDTGFGGIIDVPPESNDIRVGSHHIFTRG